MRVYVTATPIELDAAPNGLAGDVASGCLGGAPEGRTFTLKADGVVLHPDDDVPAGTQVLEVIEYVPEAGVTEPEPEQPPVDED